MFFLKELFNSMARVLGRIIIYFLLGFLLFYFFNNKVEASSFNENLYWDTPTWIQYYSGEPFATNGSTSPGQSILKSCNKTPYCLAPDGFPKYALIGYNITDNSTDSTISAFENGDKFKFQVKLDYMLNSTSINHYVDFDFKITSGNSVYNAYCDSGENLDINYVEQDERYEINYTCDVFNVDRSIRYFAFQLYTSNDLFYSVGVLENFSVIVTPLDVGDIIANQNQNTQDIINNQNQNQQQTNQGLQDIEDAILDTSQPDIDNFNYTDSTGGLISTFLTMPITLLRVMNNTDSCRSITLGELFGTPLRFDCVNPGTFLGDTLWNIIDYFIVFTMITSIAQLFIYVYEKFKNLDDFFNEFYTPQHMAPEEYIPRHGGGK